MNNDFGSKKPLNWQQPALPGATEKSVSHAERAEAYFRMGTPPTRRGSFHGFPSAFAPNQFHPDLNPLLMLDMSKALGTMQVPLRSEDQGQTPDQGQAQPKVPGQPAVPGMAGMPPVGDQPSIGMTPGGQPIYSDPFHPAHKDFSLADHMMAADQNRKMGNDLGAQAHELMGDDIQSPMDRFAGKFAGQGPNPSGTPAGGRTLMQGQPQGNIQPGSPLAQLPGQGPAGGMGPGSPKPPGPPGPPVGQMGGLMGPPPGGPPRPPAASLTPGQQPLGPAGPAMGKPPGGGAMGPVGGPPAPGQGPADVGSGDAKGDPFASLLAKLSPDQGKPMMGNPTSDRMGPKPGMQMAAPTPGSSTVQQPIGTPGPRNQSAGPLAPSTNAGFQGTYINPDPMRQPASYGNTGSSLSDQMAQMQQPMPQPMYSKAMEQFLKLV